MCVPKIDVLHKEIEQLRSHLEEQIIVDDRTLTDSHIINLSQELDKLLNTYNRLLIDR